MKHIVFFTGSGISAESGIQTFREAGTGLWENFRIEDVCTHEAMLYNRDVVVDFYNHMRQQLLTKQPNLAHQAIAELQKLAATRDDLKVSVVTQNVDDLHERAGSHDVVHLHGELMKLRSSKNELAALSQEDKPDLFEDGWKQRKDDTHPDGSLLRPFIVFFGESVPMFEEAVRVASTADVLVVVGTSLAVYPAASLLQYTPSGTPIYLVDPYKPEIPDSLKDRVTFIQKPATQGIPEVCQQLV